MKFKNLFIKISVVVTYLGMVIVNSLANALPINGVTTGQVSDSYPNLFAPIGLTFSIWGVIYALLAAYTLYQLGLFEKNKSEKRDNLFKKIGVYFSITSVINILWIFAWHYDLMPLSLILMAALLIFLIKIADILNKEKLTIREKIFMLLPFTVYFAWITVATIANVTVLLVSLNWNGFNLSEQLWTVLVLFIGTIIGIWRMFKDKNIFYGLVFVWAYFGIWLKHLSTQGFSGQYLEIIISTVICISIFLVGILFLRAKQISQKK